MIEELRKKLPFEEFDYQMLLNSLKEYKKPRDKITRLLATNKIIRVKKGLYIFGEDNRKTSVSREVLANMIYGPSYISKEYALAFYGLIPKKGNAVTSMTTVKNKLFDTPLGIFSYKYLETKKYACGIRSMQLDSVRYCLFASKEKALADLVAGLKTIATEKELHEYLIQTLQIQEEEIKNLDHQLLKQIAEVYHSKQVNRLLTLVMGKEGI